MNLRTEISKARVWFKRRKSLGALENIAVVRGRSSDFEEIRQRVRQAGTDSLSHFGNGYTHEGGFYLQQNPDEFAALTIFLKERGPYARYLEIGSASGGACLFLHREIGFGSVVSLDDGRHPRAVAQAEHFSQVQNFKQFLGDSHSEEARTFLKQNVPDKLDVAFIDGDHSFAGVWQDIQLTRPFCRRGTLLILHDTIACEDVNKAWLQAVQQKILKPLAEFIGKEKPLGIAVGEII